RFGQGVRIVAALVEQHATQAVAAVPVATALVDVIAAGTRLAVRSVRRAAQVVSLSAGRGERGVAAGRGAGEVDGAADVGVAGAVLVTAQAEGIQRPHVERVARSPLLVERQAVEAVLAGRHRPALKEREAGATALIEHGRGAAAKAVRLRERGC